ncbi:MAG: hypothetical protein NW207_10085 [Cytophagales bacterium]|nr:hypothetical protein [Cytophagales bacterium]
MKKILFLCLTLAICEVSTAQLTNVIIALQEGNVPVAKKNIDAYMAKEKSATDAKGYFYKGNVYETIFLSKDAAITALEANPLPIAVEAYMKSVSLDKPKGEWVTKSKERLENLWASSYNKSIELYKANDMDGALKYIEITQLIKADDTTAFSIGASFAITSEKFEKAIEYYNKLIALNTQNLSVYKNLLYIYTQKIKNNDKAIEICGLGRKKFPNESSFMAEEVNIYIATNRTAEAIAKLNDAVQNDKPNAKVYLYNLGILYKQTGDNIKAKENFVQSLAIDSLYEGANYMLGFMTMEEGDVINKKINNMNMKDYTAIGKKEEAKRDALYKKAIPYLEKSYKVNKDPKLKEQLTSIYTKFKMTDKIKSLE